jgi:hypothetical protein
MKTGTIKLIRCNSPYCGVEIPEAIATNFDMFCNVRTVISGAKPGFDRSKGFKLADLLKFVFLIAFLHRLYSIAKC